MTSPPTITTAFLAFLSTLGACAEQPAPKGGAQEPASDTGDSAVDAVDDSAVDSGTDSTAMGTDADADGWTVDGGDCDDSDPDVHPGADETLCDGRDSDCDGVTESAPFVVDSVPYSGFQVALDAMVDGSTMLVCPGDWQANGVMTGTGSRTLAAWNGDASSTILDGAAVDRVLSVGDGLALRIGT
jgi:hypothetical protein